MKEQKVYISDHVTVYIRNGEYVVETNNASQDEIDRARQRCGIEEISDGPKRVVGARH